MSEPWSSMQRSKRTTRTTLRSERSSVLEKRKERAKKINKGLDRADIVRDFRFSALAGFAVRRFVILRTGRRIGSARVSTPKAIPQPTSGVACEIRFSL